MKTLNELLKAFQSIRKLDFKNKLVSLIKKEELSKESDSLLKQMNTKESEFLFI